MISEVCMLQNKTEAAKRKEIPIQLKILQKLYIIKAAADTTCYQLVYLETNKLSLSTTRGNTHASFTAFKIKVRFYISINV